MDDILQNFEKNILSIPDAKEELLPPATNEELDKAELILGISFPSEFRDLYLWHNGQKGNIFLFGEYRISPLKELLELNRIGRKSITPDLTEIFDSAGTIKDSIANPKWIQFGDNGGNTILFLDMDPGEKGTVGQILESCDGEKECDFAGAKDFISNITNKITTGKIVWNKEAGSFWETEDKPEKNSFKWKISKENIMGFIILFPIIILQALFVFTFRMIAKIFSFFKTKPNA